ncbi:hypothetical protein NIES267_75540 (plasmid) [Calothrix parasitica NIES-267]|uniref:Uncharacterized protein n=1 Tax=Calothrix parasitica NIES-267 TaxID=1973488 RepID=A0A1Z4M351_9CYAN|nr:hypothetical protein NIES267_73080 [Calothrix parasitica NIES-267]BAY87902.1 hypothetical protein NIES267_74260 [Calothrix parasitica NIES-267]BAY87958.1 hypothetical protein NIES267_74820 [Calothrix parasitica NIES-267]BAY88012.1 hypothetical protein NIES267_75540 [Calothrix parasitica NIES-267]
MNLSIHPTSKLRTLHRRIIIYPKGNWFTLHYSYLGKKDVYRYDLYKVVLAEVKDILLELMERLEKWKIENR